MTLKQIPRFEFETDIPKNYTGEVFVVFHKKYLFLKEGNLHREDGPAMILEDGKNAWYFEGQLHRLDGACMFDEHGKPLFYAIHGKGVNKQSYWSHPKVIKLKLERIILVDTE